MDVYCISCLDSLCSVDDHLGEELGVGPDQLAGHAGLGGVDQAVLAKIINLGERIVKREIALKLF